MNLEQQVCSLDLAKRLKELGVKQESVFTWVMSTHCPTHMEGDYKLQTFDSPFFGAVHNYFAAGRDNPKSPMFAAFTVGELGELLYCGDVKRFITFQTAEHWTCELQDGNWEYLNSAHADTEADARARMLIYLIENKLITV